MVRTRHVLLQYFDFLTSHKKDECIRKVETREQMQKQRKLTGSVQNQDHVDALEDLMEVFRQSVEHVPDVNQFLYSLFLHCARRGKRVIDDDITNLSSETLIHAGNRLQHSYGHYVSFVNPDISLGSEQSASDVFDMMQDGEDEASSIVILRCFSRNGHVTDLYLFEDIQYGNATTTKST